MSVVTKFRHYKGGYYQVIGVAFHTETDEPLVIYHELNEPGILWARPLAMFHEKLPDGRKRFEAAG